MKALQYVIAVGCLSLAGVAYCQEDAATPTYPVPFYNVVIDGGKKITATYNFDSRSQILVCKKISGDAMEALTWKYKEVSYKTQMPVFLKDDASFDGQWADPSGELSISNIFPDNPSIIVNCEYQTMR